MNVNVKYFGIIAELTTKTTQNLYLKDKSMLNDFQELITSLYPELNGYIFKIAINHTICESNIELNENDELALLPPFAGG